MKSKTRSEMAAAYGVSRKTFYNWLKKEGIILKSRYLSPKEIEEVYKNFGKPSENGRV
jgi:DNA-binding XRE family transcriptional regulator